MRSTLFVTLFTLFLASLSFARTVRIAAPATVKKGKSFKVTFETESFREADTEFTAILGFSNDPSCENCIGTLAGAFDLL
ncbi:hypothetical protein FRB96_005392 [Tulasnella sp. 330]|nr:hypothetical protein FRB96_005392 [Tulasnella sp. 330]